MLDYEDEVSLNNNLGDNAGETDGGYVPLCGPANQSIREVVDMQSRQSQL